MPRRMAGGLLRVLGQEVGIPQLALDQASCCTLAFDDIVVNFEADEAAHELFLYASLGSLPEEAPAELYRELLDGNLFWKDTGGATIGLDRQGQRVILLQTVALGRTSDADFKALVERFVNVAEGWTRCLEDAMAQGTAPAAEAALQPTLVHPGMFV